VFLPEETLNWKSGHSLSMCLLCHNNSEVNANCLSEPQTTPLSSNTQSGVTPQKRALQTSASKETAKRNCQSLEQRVQVITYAKDHPNKGYFKVAEKFGIGRTQAQKILTHRGNPYSIQK